MTEAIREDLGAAVVATTPDAVIVADRQGKVLLWNPGAERIFGYAAAEALGQSLDLIVPERQRARHWDGYMKVMESGVTRYGAGDLLAVPAMRKDGARISIEFSIALLKEPDGRVAGAVAIVRDVTERWERERALRARVAELERRES